MGTTFYFAWEPALMQWIQSANTRVLTLAASFFTLFGEELTMVAVLGFLYWCWDKEWGKWIGTNAICAFMAGPMIKNAVLRRRPYMDCPGVECLRAAYKGDINDIAVQGYSFPSLHAVNSVTVYGSLACKVRKKWYTVLTALLIFFIGFSRVCIGVHYPTDILAGWLLGGIVMAVISKLQKNRLVLLGVLAVLSLPGWFYCTSEDFFSAYGLLFGISLGFWLDDRFVHFENTKNTWYRILRLVCGIVVFLVLDKGMKLLVPAELPDFAANLVRTVRYLIASFVTIGVYPMAFRIVEKRALP